MTRGMSVGDFAEQNVRLAQQLLTKQAEINAKQREIDRLRQDAESYEHLRDEIIATMRPDADSWDDDAAEEGILVDYVKHLTEGHTCQRCDPEEGR